MKKPLPEVTKPADTTKKPRNAPPRTAPLITAPGGARELRRAKTGNGKQIMAVIQEAQATRLREEREAKGRRGGAREVGADKRGKSVMGRKAKEIRRNDDMERVMKRDRKTPENQASGPPGC